jgi:hypothetical protein
MVAKTPLRCTKKVGQPEKKVKKKGDFRVCIRYACFTAYHQGRRKLRRRLREEI